MVSKNNQNNFLWGKEEPHYGLRKLSVGVASVLLSTAILAGMNTKAQAATANKEANQEIGQEQKTPVSNSNGSVTLRTGTNPAGQTQQSDQQAITPTTPINSQVGQTINVIKHTVTETTGDKASGERGQTSLDLEMKMLANAARQIKAGDYIDIKLGMPYITIKGNRYTFSYGAVNNEKDNIKPIQYQGHTIGYIVPSGDTESYKQSSPETSSTGMIKWDEIDNENKDDISNAGSNGYYRIIFNDVLSNYLRNQSGENGDVDIKAKMIWYNISSNGDKQVLKPSETITLYSDDGATSYTPHNDLQIGNESFNSGIRLNVVKRKRGGSDISVTSKPQAIDHTGNTPAHMWRKIDGKETLQVTDNQWQGVGISLANLGRNFTITVTKPASNQDVTTSFVSAENLQKALQGLIVPSDSKVSSYLVDHLTNNDSYYLSDQFTYQKPKVKVTAVEDGSDKETYHVVIDDDYKGFKTTSAGDDGTGKSINLSPVTLITWTPTMRNALLPEEGITSSEEDTKKATYFNQQKKNWLYGYSIRNEKVRDYMNGHPWHVNVASQGKTNYDTDYGYWIDMGTDSKPLNQAAVNSIFYGIIRQTIHYVDVKGDQMKDDNGKLIPDKVRQVTFTSDTGVSGSFKTKEQFDDIDIPGVTHYSTYRGNKTDNKVVYSGKRISEIGSEKPFGYPHDNFEEYVVYVKDEPKPDPQPTPKPKPDPKPDPTPQPKPQPQPVPEPQPQPTPKPQPKPDPTPTPRPQPKPDLQLNPQPQLQPQPVPEPQPQPIPTPTPQPSQTPTPQPTPQNNPNPGPIKVKKPNTVLSVQNKPITEQPQLPQTGSGQDKGVLALGLASLLTSFGLGMKKKKNI
ncbi:MAG: YSIRK-type signal peptide-containing protein [Limosilactobacillus sp.]|uniref:YSIRK-type signal peptide-containing protein n=1 Tax=Limosilactobacillus sp. TaxID=2773925 RepID=UPI0025BBC840|nr:YSIRK-type signal peptide-containing protein [Limosilactobacillus sp.]MCI1975321.1 YSIRK-type signal peptide-containing protein [Limosilactobacillus sp.]MCI2031032.1 YSIRK-type signal peptide-containing protein [Limosilactobacillus sp.]